jgi:hypothetical protein
VSEVARDPSLHGCAKGRAVSEVASGKANPKPCPPQGTVPDADEPDDDPEDDESGDDGGVETQGRRPGPPPHAGPWGR